MDDRLFSPEEQRRQLALSQALNFASASRGIAGASDDHRALLKVAAAIEAYLKGPDDVAAQAAEMAQAA